MAEGVVVELEAVEVEKQQGPGIGVVGDERALEVGEQLAAIAQARKGVGEGLSLPAGGEQAQLELRDDLARERGQRLDLIVASFLGTTSIAHRVPSA